MLFDKHKGRVAFRLTPSGIYTGSGLLNFPRRTSSSLSHERYYSTTTMPIVRRAIRVPDGATRLLTGLAGVTMPHCCWRRRRGSRPGGSIGR